ncbi:crystallin [Petrotoga sp. HKA.pet.4.5]|jgi:ADP-ribosylglycohydrolase|uniref:ADP-ribosylglycohydrolase family protein n=1 Tax=unclassified Petrotoga TaxID=2620614 RepID=UPI000EF1305B|nr:MULTISPECIES: ADP-ribosylglycohydrolase family protein [unclassified Petrotoga]RLL84559.1 crystallin [Petrotoga sp. Shatin.DS.tank11.9.2.9.3]RLL89450.1 crystallin [Petrotoga sp. HKA.pet.4.5]
MKAWENEFNRRRNAKPKKDHIEKWEDVEKMNVFPKEILVTLWDSKVPGSNAPESLIVGAVQSVENMGKNVNQAELLLDKGFEALKNKDYSKLKAITSEIFFSLSKADSLDNNAYEKYDRPLDWEDISNSFPKQKFNNIDNLKDKIHGGWLGQLAGGSMGTKLEGYTHDALEETYSDQLGTYIGEVSTINDDVTYELIFLKTYEEKWGRITSKDLAKNWISYIPFGWSAELIALENIKRGIFPPESGFFNNPFQEWIGAQMRCMVHGLLQPGDPYNAAKLSFIDSQVSHSGNGIYGGIHSAVMTSLAFSEKDPRKIIEKSLDYIPKNTEFKKVVDNVVKYCQANNDWINVLRKTEDNFQRYNWVHLYPNTASVLTSLWFGEGDFDKTMKIVSSFGYDVDCNAGEVGTILGIMYGANDFPSYWSDPLKDTLETYLPDFSKIKISTLAQWTFKLSTQKGINRS